MTLTLPGLKSTLSKIAAGSASMTPNDLLGSFANYNALTDAPIPGAVGNETSGVGGGGGPSGATPNIDYFMNLINNDPLYKQLGSDLSAQGIADASQTGAGILRSLVNRGVVPNLATSAAQLGLSPDIVNWIRNNVDLGQAAGLASQANTAGVSQEANLEHQHTLNMGNIADQLAARGLLRSGANAFLNGEEERSYTNQQHAADQALADYISGAYSAFAKNEQARQLQLGQGANDAMTRAMQLYGSVPAPSGGGSAPPPPPSSAPSAPTTTNPYLHPVAVRLPGVTAV